MCTETIHKRLKSGSEIQVDLSSKSVQTLNPVYNYVQLSAV